jgi:hypothetical protein
MKVYFEEVNMWYEIIGSIGLIIWGILSLRAFALNKKALFFISYTDEFLPKKLFGDNYNRIMNLILGIIELLCGLYILYKLIK